MRETKGGSCLPGTKAMDAGVVVAIEEDGFGRGDGLQARHDDAHGIDGRRYGPANVVEHQVGRRNVSRGALGDVDVFVLCRENFV